MLVRGIPIDDVTWDGSIDEWVNTLGANDPVRGYRTFANDARHGNQKRLAAHAKLLVIAAYLNDGWVPDWHEKDAWVKSSKWVIEYESGRFVSESYTSTHPGLPVFKSKELADKAIELMGDDLYTLFNIPKP